MDKTDETQCPVFVTIERWPGAGNFAPWPGLFDLRP
jgi:hypothetical protein